MKVAAISALPFDLELVCFGTLSKYIQHGHEVYIIICNATIAWTRIKKDIIKSLSERIGISGLHFIDKFDYSAVTQDNVNMLTSTLEKVNPDLVIIPFIKAHNQKRRILAGSSLIAARMIDNILMYELNKSSVFTPNVYSIISNKTICDISDLITSNLKHNEDRVYIKKKIKELHIAYSYKIGTKVLVEAFKSHKITLNDMF